MSKKFLALARKLLASFILSVALLAISSFQTMFKPSQFSEVQITKSTDPQHRGLFVHNTVSKQQQLHEALMQDELGEGSPFASLSSSEPLNDIYKRGIQSFDRTTFRSASYIKEEGYDLIRYDIEHPDHSHSYVLAYLEAERAPAEVLDTESVAKVPVVLILASSSEVWESYVFRSGLLSQHKTLKEAEAMEILEARLASSVPFLSVAR